MSEDKTMGYIVQDIGERLDKLGKEVAALKRKVSNLENVVGEL